MGLPLWRKPDQGRRPYLFRRFQPIRSLRLNFERTKPKIQEIWKSIEPPEKKARKSLEEEMGKLMERTREGYDLTAAALDKVQQHLDISRQTSKDIAQLAQEVHCEKVGAKYQLAQLQQVLSSFQHLEWQVGGTKAGIPH